jgi:hypothetical protein
MAAPHPSDFEGVAAFMRPRVREFYKGKAWVHLIDPTTIVRGPMDIAAGTTSVSVTPVWSGWARVQPLRNTVSTWRASNPTTTRIVQFWVDDPETVTVDFKPGLRFAVDPDFPTNDPSHSQYLYVTLGGINSSQAWQRTVDTQVDLENRPNYDMSAWPKPDPDEVEDDGSGDLDGGTP